MSSGHYDDEPTERDLAQLEAVWGNEAVRNEAQSVVRCVRSYRVPYLGGISVDGETLYVDSGLPTSVASVPLELAFGLHEAVERALVVVLGWKYEPAHKVALAAERLGVEQAGHAWEPYRVELEPYFRPTEHERLDKDNVPRDLMLYPYVGDTGLMHRLVSLGVEKIAKDLVGFRHGTVSKRCGLCTMWLPSEQRCSVVQGEVDADDLCDVFERKKAARAA